jgi:hypothetical protein
MNLITKRKGMSKVITTTTRENYGDGAFFHSVRDMFEAAMTGGFIE